MGMYYISVCHDCKTQIQYTSKWVESSAEYYHNKFTKDHKEHKTELGNDYNDDFCFKVWEYKRVDEGKYY